MSVSLVKCPIIDVPSKINHYFSQKRTCSCVLRVEFNLFYRMWLVFWRNNTSFQIAIINHTQNVCSVGEMPDNRRFFENESLFLTETQMFLCSACRVQQMPSIETSFEGIARVFKCYVPRFKSVEMIRDFWIFVNGAPIILKCVTAQRILLEAVSSSNPSG